MLQAQLQTIRKGPHGSAKLPNSGAGLRYRTLTLGLLICLASALFSNQARSSDSNQAFTPKTFDAPVNVLAFWSSACSYCPKVMSELEELRKQFGEDRVQFLAVSHDSEEQPDQYLQKNGIQMKSVKNGADLMRTVKAPGFPWVVIVNANGEVLANPSRGTAPVNVPSLVKMDLILRRMGSLQAAVTTVQKRPG